MARGGKRQGIAGRQYPNRSDLAGQPRKLTPAAPTGLPYGEHQQLIQSQQQVPMGSGPNFAPPQLPDNRPLLSDAVAALPQLGSGTQRPDEPMTHGSPFGPGPGPEVLQQLRPTAVQTAASILNTLTGDLPPELKSLRDRLNAVTSNEGAA